MEQLNSTAVIPNISYSPGRPPAVSWDPATVSAAVVMSISFLLGVSGNLAVIILRPNWQHLSTLSQVLMLNLAVSDMLSVLPLPLWIYSSLYGWIFSLAACKIVTYFVHCSLYASLLTVTVLSVQRYLQIVYLQGCLHQVGSIVLLTLLWLVAMTLSVYALVVPQLITDQHGTFCRYKYSSTTQHMAVLLIESLVGFISFFVLAFAYICLHRRVNNGAFFNHPQMTKLLTSIVVTSFVLWIPHHVINVLGVAALSLNNQHLLKFYTDGWKIVIALIFVNSCLNPILYAFASHKMCTSCQTTEN